MRKVSIGSLLLLLMSLFLAGTCLAYGEASESPGAKPLPPGQVVPDFTLPAPLSPAHAEYLGLPAAKAGTLRQLAADVLVVEVYSMYCPFCQVEAPLINELYQELQKQNNPRVRLFGVAAGNSQTEVDVYQKKYKVEYPLLPDMDFTMHKLLGNVGTPFFYVLRRDAASGDFTVVANWTGRLESIQWVLDQVAAAQKTNPSGQ